MGDNRRNGGATVPLLRSVVVDGGEMKDKERPKEPWKGEFVKSIVYAGLDAIVTSFSLISSISAGRLSSGQWAMPINFWCIIMYIYICVCFFSFPLNIYVYDFINLGTSLCL